MNRAMSGSFSTAVRRCGSMGAGCPSGTHPARSPYRAGGKETTRQALGCWRENPVSSCLTDSTDLFSTTATTGRVPSRRSPSGRLGMQSPCKPVRRGVGHPVYRCQVGRRFTVCSLVDAKDGRLNQGGFVSASLLLNQDGAWQAKSGVMRGNDHRAERADHAALARCSGAGVPRTAVCLRRRFASIFRSSSAANKTNGTTAKTLHVHTGRGFVPRTMFPSGV